MSTAIYHLLLFGKRVPFVFRDPLTPDIPAGSLDGTGGNGFCRNVTDTENKLSLSGGEMLFAGGKATPAWGDPGIWYEQDDCASAFDRVAGRTFGVTSRHGTNSDYLIGWDTNTNGTLADGFFRIAGPGSFMLRGVTGSSKEKITTIAVDTDYNFLTQLRATGAYHVFGLTTETPELVGIDDTLTNDPIYPAISNFDGNPTISKSAVKDITVITPNVSDTFDNVTATDESDNNLDGTYHRVGLNGSEAQFDGNGYVQLPAAALDSAGWDGDVGSIIAHVTPGDNDGYIVTIGKDSSNELYIGFTSSGTVGIVVRKVAGVSKNSTFTGAGVGVEQVIAGNWDRVTDDELTVLINGVPDATPASSLPAWTETPLDAFSVIGARTNTLAEAFEGVIHNVIYTLGVEVSITNHVNIKTKLLAGTLTGTDLDAYIGVGKWAWYKNEETHTSNGLVTPIDATGAGANVAWEYGATDDNKAYAVAVPGDDVVVNGDFATDTDWTKGTGWTIAAGVATKTAGTPSDLSQTVDPLTLGAWYKHTYTVANRTAGIITPKLGTTALGAQITNATFTEYGRANGVSYALTANGAFDGDVDDVIIEQLQLSDLISVHDTGSAFPYLRANLTVDADGQGGFTLWADSQTNPQNCVLAYIDNVSNTFEVVKYVAGTPSVLSSAAYTYSAGDQLEVRYQTVTGVQELHVTNKTTNTKVVDGLDISSLTLTSTKHGLFLTGDSYAENYESRHTRQPDALAVLA